MKPAFNFQEIDRLESAWPQIKDQFMGKARLSEAEALAHLNSVGVAAADAVGQHAPEDMLAANLHLFKADMQHAMGWFERARVFERLGLPQALGALHNSASSGEADGLLASCDAAIADGIEDFGLFYRGLVFDLFQERDQAVAAFRQANGFERLGNRPSVKLIGLLYRQGKQDEAAAVVVEALQKGHLSNELLRHISKYLNLAGLPHAAQHFTRVCVQNGWSF